MAAPQATILIVDDEELNRDGLARRLQRHDYEVYSRRSETAHFPRRRPAVVRLPSAAQVGLGRLTIIRRLLKGP